MEQWELRAREIKALITSVLVFLQVLFGWWWILFFVWVGSMSVDWFTGTRSAAKRGEWSSSRSRDGRLHKKAMLSLVIQSVLLDIILYVGVAFIPYMSDLPFEYPMVVSASSMVWFTLTEVGSTIENVIKMGHSCPPILAGMLKIMQSRLKKAGEDVKNIDDT